MKRFPDEKNGLANGQPDFRVDTSLNRFARFFVDESLFYIYVCKKNNFSKDGTLKT